MFSWLFTIHIVLSSLVGSVWMQAWLFIMEVAILNNPLAPHRWVQCAYWIDGYPSHTPYWDDCDIANLTFPHRNTGCQPLIFRDVEVARIMTGKWHTWLKLVRITFLWRKKYNHRISLKGEHQRDKQAHFGHTKWWNTPKFELVRHYVQIIPRNANYKIKYHWHKNYVRESRTKLVFSPAWTDVMKPDQSIEAWRCTYVSVNWLENHCNAFLYINRAFRKKWFK